MSGDINKDAIRSAIDRLQAEHPVQFSFDVTKFDNGTDFTGIQRVIDVFAKKCQDDAEINIICEMAKLYLDGVKPTVERPHGEWIPIKWADEETQCKLREYPFDGKWVIVTDGKNISVERIKRDAIDHFYPAGRWFELEDVVAWMPLPEAYAEEGDEK